jgi:hypothetical protein
MQKSKLPAGALAVLLAPLAVHGAILTGVPMQGSMAMPMVAYHADDGRMHVTMPADVPQLTPLLVSNPGDGFDPADPWFDALDPSRQGAAFSRRYGFVMDAMSDPLPPGTEMWIRKLSGPSGLTFHRYSGSDPKAFAPIFGADGTTNALYWDGVMFHPVVAAPPSTNGYTATFEVYLLDSASGQEMPNSSSDPLVFNWTDVSDGRPPLTIAQTNGQNVVVGWPLDTAANWVLESASQVNTATWTSVTNAPATLDGQPRVLLGAGAAQQYFRMRYVP